MSYGPNLANAAGSFNPNLAGIGQVGQSGCAASNGGSFAVTSASPVSPTGVSVLAENLAIEGPLAVGGNLPFLGTVGVEGAMLGVGAGSVSYGCGSGNLGIVSENAAGVAGPYGLAASPIAGYGMVGSPISTGQVMGPYGSTGAPIAPVVGGRAIAGSYSLAGSSSPSAGITGQFGVAGSPIGPTSYGPGFSGYNGFGGLNGLRK